MSCGCVLRVVLSILEVVGGYGVVMRIVVQLFSVGMIMLCCLKLDFHRMLVSILQLL